MPLGAQDDTCIGGGGLRGGRRIRGAPALSHRTERSRRGRRKESYTRYRRGGKPQPVVDEPGAALADALTQDAHEQSR
jgi:hypothetical protein